VPPVERHTPVRYKGGVKLLPKLIRWGVLAWLAYLAYSHWPSIVAKVTALAPQLTGVTQPVAPPAPSCPVGGRSMARLELLFGLVRPGGIAITQPEWQAFVDLEVTPRFPAGLTVLPGDGQWRTSAGVIERLPSKVLVIWHDRAQGTEQRIEAIRRAYKARFAQESVMRIDSTSCVAF